MGRVRVAMLSRYLNPLIMKSGSKLPSQRLPMGYTNKSRRAVDCLFAILHTTGIVLAFPFTRPKCYCPLPAALKFRESRRDQVPVIVVAATLLLRTILPDTAYLSSTHQATPTPPQLHSGPSGHSYTFIK